MRSIKSAKILPGTIALVRTDWNVPFKDGKISDNSRILASQKTIEFILEKGGKVIVLSHLGDGTYSLEPVVEVASEIFKGRKIEFIKDPWNNSSEDGKKILQHLNLSEIAVFENVRFWMEKENDEAFANMLAQFGDIYVNEAFSVSHRKHTTIFSLPKLLPAYAGFSFMEEYEKLSTLFEPEHPFLIILGGAKFETKLPLIEKFMNLADKIFIGGAMASYASEKPEFKVEKVLFPNQSFNDLDANADTLKMLDREIKEAKFILWNGPLGKYEDGYKEGTVALAKLLASSKAKVIVGGGDTLSVIKETGLENDFYFVSMAGGAMLDFLSSGTLPGIEALDSTPIQE